MDNRIFAVNGQGYDKLLQAMELVFDQGWGYRARGWYESEKGLVIVWHIDPNNTTVNKLPGDGHDARSLIPLVDNWLRTPKLVDKVELGQWEGNLDHDGSNQLGWKVYVEDWGHVGRDSYAICAIKPVYIWFGK